jgi:hypothetical protein
MCGEGYQVRTSAPSCRIRFLEAIEQLHAQHSTSSTTLRREVLDALVRRRFKWPKPLREAMLDQFERWQAWKAGTAQSHTTG